MSNSTCYPCNSNLPSNCGIDACLSFKTGTDLVFYNSAALPNTGINTCDSLTLALQKIDNYLLPDNIATLILTSIQNNGNLQNILCLLTNACTTTTTTTVYVPNCHHYQFDAVDGVFNLRQCGQASENLAISGSPLMCLDSNHPITLMSGTGIIPSPSTSCS